MAFKPDFNLYEALGVDADAPAPAIKAAFREKAKTNHPDAGGEADAFERVKLAYDVLSDPERREHYDKTGDVIGEAPDNSDQAAYGVLSRMLQIALMNEQDPFAPGFDVVLAMKTALDADIKNISNEIRKMHRALDRARRMQKRFRRRGGGENMMARLLDKHIQQIDESLPGTEGSLRQFQRARVLINEYEYDHSSFAIRYFGAPTGNGTASSSGGFFL